MNTKKTPTDRKILLYELQHIVQELYPKKRTVNPYQRETQNYLAQLVPAEQLLFHHLLHCVTLINQHGRSKERQTIVSSQTDILNTMRLLESEQIPFNQKAITAYYKLYKRFKHTPITLLDAQVVLRKSQSSIKRYFILLQKIELLKSVEEKRGQKYQYQLLKKAPQKPTEAKGIYEEAFEQWEDYTGFIDLQTRT